MPDIRYKTLLFVVDNDTGIAALRIYNLLLVRLEDVWAHKVVDHSRVAAPRVHAVAAHPKRGASPGGPPQTQAESSTFATVNHLKV